MKKKLLILFTLITVMVINVSAQFYSQISPTLNTGKVLYMTKPGNVDANSILWDQAIIDDLTGAGYAITLGYPGEGGAINKVELESYDLVVVGRNISSGDFALVEAWAELEVPVLILSGYIIRSNRLKYINSSSVKREATNAVESNMDRITKALVADVDDYAFSKVDVTDGKMDYMTWFYDYLAYGVDSFATTNNGKVLASIIDADTTVANGNVLMARWETGVETYEGSANTPKSYRSYLQMGADDKSDPKNINYNQFTTASFRVLINEMNFLIRTGKEVQYIVLETNVDADGVLYDQKVIDDLEAVGYTNLVKTYPADDGAIDKGTLNNADLVVIGRNISSSQFKLPEAWVPVETPVLMLSGYIVRNSRLKFLNTSASNREITEGLETNMDRITKALVADVSDSAFIGVPIADSKMDYMTWFYDYIGYGIDSFATTNNGKLLASIVDAELPEANGNVLMVRWEPNVETYAGSGVTPMGFRTYLQMGADDKSDPKKMNYAQYTDASFDLMVNEMSYLTSLYAPAGIVLSNDASVASIELSAGELNPAFSSDVYNYAVSLPAGTTEVPTLTITTTNENATINLVEAETLPGNTVFKVKSEDEQNETTFIIAFTVEGGNEGDEVEPGMGTLDAAVMVAADGDTLVLKSGEQYDILSPLDIDKKLTIIASEIPELPGLDNMPIISNMFTSTQIFGLKTNCDLTLIGIDVDALGGSHIFNPMADSNQVITLNINRCRLHNTIDDILNDDGSATNNITYGSIMVQNSFIYDNGTGHGFYTKFVYSSGLDWRFENITMWNIGQQFNWIRALGEDQTQKIVYDHFTGYNLSTSADDKELFGNDEKTTEDAIPEANLVIEFTNNIMSTQVSANEGSLIFKNTDGFHDISIKNNVFHSVAPSANIGSVTESGNMIDVDPLFADPDNADFTVGNSDLFSAATDGEIIGATYWHPDFVDDFSDVETSKNTINRNELNVSLYPNPVNDILHLNLNLKSSSDVELTILGINGQIVHQKDLGMFSAGNKTFSIDLNDLSNGIYFYNITTKSSISTGKLIKN